MADEKLVLAKAISDRADRQMIANTPTKRPATVISFASATMVATVQVDGDPVGNYTQAEMMFRGAVAPGERVMIEFNPPRGAFVMGGIGDSRLSWQSWSPVWTSTAIQPAIGNGALRGRFQDQGGVLEIWIHLLFGTTTTPGTGQWTFTIPPGFTIRNGGTDQRMPTHGVAFDSSSGKHYKGQGFVEPGGVTISRSVFTDGTLGMDRNDPFVWATGDHMEQMGRLLL